MRLLWLPDVLSSAGLQVSVHPGWETKGRDLTQPLVGWMKHHTASAPGRNAPCYELCYSGRSDLPGPLCQDLLARDGTHIIEASGRANHAGSGEWRGVTDGNGRFGATEIENNGVGEPYPARQYDSAVVGTAAILRHLHLDASMVPGHKEYGRPLGRKSDPSFDMHRFRADVSSLLSWPPKPQPPKEFDMAHAAIYPYKDGTLRGVLVGTDDKAYHYVGKDMASLAAADGTELPGRWKSVSGCFTPDGSREVVWGQGVDDGAYIVEWTAEKGWQGPTKHKTARLKP